MAATRNTRKTAAAKPAAADDTSVTEAEKTATELEATLADNHVTAADNHVTVAAAEETPEPDASPKTPDAAPLEPPTVHAPPEPPAGLGFVSPTEVIPDEEHLSDVILDDATKEPPADVDAVFQPVTPYGSTLICTIRLIERTFLGPHNNPVERLLQPKGAHVSESIAARIRERLDAQVIAASAEK